MSLSNKAKDIGVTLFGIAILLGILTLGIAILYGAAELSLWALEWAPAVVGTAIVLCLFVMTPLSLIPSTRGIAGNGLYIASYAFGFALWILAMAFIYVTWGLMPVIIGLLLGVIGVVPIGIIASIVEGHWVVLGNLATLLLLTYLTRGLGIWLIQKAADREIALAEERARAELTFPARRLD
jgi:hypothetical protein